MVRAMASAVNGSLDGALMIASLRSTMLRMMVHNDRDTALPATMCRVRAPKHRTSSSVPSSSVCGTQPSRYLIPTVLSAISVMNSRVSRFCRPMYDPLTMVGVVGAVRYDSSQASCRYWFLSSARRLPSSTA
ncbi:hypothetical protein D3C76_944070 [compost metagenome]